MIIATFGFRGITGQINRIEDGFRFLGHTISKENPELIYANDIGSWDEAINLYSQFPNSKCILTILDLPIHLKDDCKRQMAYIERVVQDRPEIKFCTISEFCHNTISELCNIDCEIIYQPTKDIHYEGVKWEDRKINYLIVGRNNDPIKEHRTITIPVINEIGGELYTVGEPISGAQNYGNISDEDLNVIYNNTKYVFCPSSTEGLGLTGAEAIVAGCVPIFYHWNETAKELYPKDLIFESKDAIIDFILSGERIELNRYEYYKKFNKNQIAKNILDAAQIPN